MEARAVRGVVWTLLSYGGSKAISLLAMLLLTRLLMPADFGVVALALLVIGFVNLFKDLGLGATIVLRQDLGRTELGTLFTLMMGFFVLTTAVVVGLAPLTALTFREPRLTAVLAALSLSILLSSVGWFYDCLQQRELEFRNRFWAQLALSTVTWGTSVGLAVGGFGVWSLVLGQVAGAVAFSVTQLVLSPYRVRPALDRTVARDALNTGRGFMLQGTITFLQENSAFFAVGRMLNTTQVGFFSMSYRLSELPYMAVADPVAKATFPGFARMRHRGEDVTDAYLASIRIVAITATPLALILSACSGAFTRGVLGEEWAAMAGVLLVMGLWGAARPLQATLGWFLNAVGQVNLQARIVTVLLVPLVPAVFVAAALGGLTAVAWVMLADVVVSLSVFAYYAGQRTGVPLRSQWIALRPVLLASGPCWLAAYLVAGAAEPAVGSIPALAAGVLAGVAAYLAALVLAERKVLRVTLAQVREAVRREPQAVGGDS